MHAHLQSRHSVAQGAFFGGDAPLASAVPLTLEVRDHDTAAAVWEAVNSGGLESITPTDKVHAYWWRLFDLVSEAPLRHIKLVAYCKT